jgi:hypothetical protein
MDVPTYVVRAIDGAIFELLSDGDLCIRQPHAEPVTLPPGVTYALYVFLMTPGVRLALRRLDDDRQRHIWETRHG